MIWGNQGTQNVFRTYLSGQGPRSTHIPFILLIGPRHVGKTTLVLDTVHDILGDHMYQDFLHVQDFSEKIGKRHNLKLRSTDSNMVSKQLAEEFHYDDIGIEDVTMRLQKSASSGKKILFLENIDRLIPDAGHALLKSLEEPLEGRVIVASATHLSSVLVTLVSRGLALHFTTLDIGDMEAYIAAQYPQISQKELILMLSQGMPGLIPIFQDLLLSMPEAFVILESIVRSGFVKDKYAFYKALSQFQKAGVVDLILDALIASCVQKGLYDTVQDWLYLKRYMDTNVSFENLALCSLTH